MELLHETYSSIWIEAFLEHESSRELSLRGPIGLRSVRLEVSLSGSRRALFKNP